MKYVLDLPPVVVAILHPHPPLTNKDLFIPRLRAMPTTITKELEFESSDLPQSTLEMINALWNILCNFSILPRGSFWFFRMIFCDEVLLARRELIFE